MYPSLFAHSKSKLNLASIWTRPAKNCCTPDGTCCAEISLHNEFPSSYAVLGIRSTFHNQLAIAFPEQRTPAQTGAQAAH
jgi:hypothetical protein